MTVVSPATSLGTLLASVEELEQAGPGPGLDPGPDLTAGVAVPDPAQDPDLEAVAPAAGLDPALETEGAEGEGAETERAGTGAGTGREGDLAAEIRGQELDLDPSPLPGPNPRVQENLNLLIGIESPLTNQEARVLLTETSIKIDLVQGQSLLQSPNLQRQDPNLVNDLVPEALPGILRQNPGLDQSHPKDLDPGAWIRTNRVLPWLQSLQSVIRTRTL